MFIERKSSGNVFVDSKLIGHYTDLEYKKEKGDKYALFYFGVSGDTNPYVRKAKFTEFVDDNNKPYESERDFEKYLRSLLIKLPIK